MTGSVIRLADYRKLPDSPRLPATAEVTAVIVVRHRDTRARRFWRGYSAVMLTVLAIMLFCL
jgi:hypothetical protein